MAVKLSRPSRHTVVWLSSRVSDAEPVPYPPGTTLMIVPEFVDVKYTSGDGDWEVHAEVTGSVMLAAGTFTAGKGSREWSWRTGSVSLYSAPEWVKSFVDENMPPLPIREGN